MQSDSWRFGRKMAVPAKYTVTGKENIFMQLHIISSTAALSTLWHLNICICYFPSLSQHVCIFYVDLFAEVTTLAKQYF